MNDDFRLDRQQIRRAQDRAADSYESHDVLHREVEQELQSRLDFYLGTPQYILDLGAGTGRGAALLKKRYAKAEVIAVDMSLAMLRKSKRHSKLLRPFTRLAGDAMQLPFADHSMNIIHASLCFQWCDDLGALFAECQRVLAHGGFLVFSMHGPDTLTELRQSWAACDETSHVGRFLDMHDVGDTMLQAGLYDPVLDITRYTLTYDTPEKLLRELKGLGATHADAERRRTLTGKQRYRNMLAAYEAMRVDGRIPATFEIVVGHAWGPEQGQRLRLPMGGIVPTYAS